MDSFKVQAVWDWPQPHLVCVVHGFLGLAGYYCKFRSDYGSIATLLTALLRKDGFLWMEEPWRLSRPSSSR